MVHGSFIGHGSWVMDHMKGSWDMGHGSLVMGFGSLVMGPGSWSWVMVMVHRSWQRVRAKGKGP